MRQERREPLLQTSYTCGCERRHQFPMYVFAHCKDKIDHRCDCGRVNTILATLVVRTTYDVTRRYVPSAVRGEE